MEESEQNQLAFRRRYARLAQMECRNKKRNMWIWLPDLSLSNQNVIPQNRGHTERGKLKAEFYVYICVNVTPEQGEF